MDPKDFFLSPEKWRIINEYTSEPPLIDNDLVIVRTENYPAHLGIVLCSFYDPMIGDAYKVRLWNEEIKFWQSTVHVIPPEELERIENLSVIAEAM